MLKNILNLKGAQKLSKNEQQSINGVHNCTGGFGCPVSHGCVCKSGVCSGPSAHCI